MTEERTDDIVRDDPYINMLLAVDAALGVKRKGIAPIMCETDEVHVWSKK